MLEFLLPEKKETLLDYPFFKGFFEGKVDEGNFISSLNAFFKDSEFEKDLNLRGLSEADIARLKLISEGCTNLFIVVEGSDASGKTSTANLLRKKLHGANVDFPEGFWDRPKDVHQSVFFPKRLKESGDFILKALKKGDVVSARYCYSNPAFTYAYTKGVVSGDLPEDMLEPDFIIFVTATPQEIDRRIEERRANGERIPKHEDDPGLRALMRERYDEMFKDDPRVILVDNTGKKVEYVVEELVGLIKEKR